MFYSVMACSLALCSFYRLAPAFWLSCPEISGSLCPCTDTTTVWRGGSLLGSSTALKVRISPQRPGVVCAGSGGSTWTWISISSSRKQRRSSWLWSDVRMKWRGCEVTWEWIQVTWCEEVVWSWSDARMNWSGHWESSGVSLHGPWASSYVGMKWR